MKTFSVTMVRIKHRRKKEHDHYSKVIRPRHFRCGWMVLVFIREATTFSMTAVPDYYAAKLSALLCMRTTKSETQNRLSRVKLDHPTAVREKDSWVGRSFYVLARGIDWHLAGKVYRVDPRGDTVSAEVYQALTARFPGGQKAALDQNLERFGIAARIESLSMAIEEALESVPINIGFLFIDWNHSHESMLRDFLLWEARLRPGGWIAFHAVGAVHTNGPKEVVEAHVVPSPWEHRLIDEILAARRVLT